MKVLPVYNLQDLFPGNILQGKKILRWNVNNTVPQPIAFGKQLWQITVRFTDGTKISAQLKQ